MKPIITAFERSPDRGQGLARDSRVRWALEEVGQSYGERLLSFEAMKKAAHRKLHPFGQIPTYAEGELALFESGSIVLYIAEQHSGLLPKEVKKRARAVSWMFAALNTLKPPINEYQVALLLDREKSWYEERRVILEENVRKRLLDLSYRLGNADWLDGEFSAGDLLMVTVLLRASKWGALKEFPNLTAYLARGEARPAYKRAFAAQLAVYKRSEAIRK